MPVGGTMRIRTILKWLLYLVGGIVGIALLGVLTIYVLIGNDLGRTFDIEGSTIAILDDDASIAEGERLAHVRGCYGGCHGKNTVGSIFMEMPDGTQIVAPDLGLAAQKYSTRELERIIRHGIRPDGTSVLVIMPSISFYDLSDEDVGAIIAFLKTQRPGEVQLPDRNVGPLGSLLLFYYKQIVGTILAAEKIDHEMPRIDPAKDNPSAHGRYLAFTICTECHGFDLRGEAGVGAPDLAIAVAYTAENFRKLLRTGVPMDGRELGLMAKMATNRFSHLTDGEVDALHTYLRTLATQPVDH